MAEPQLAFELARGLHAGQAMMRDVLGEARGLLAALAYFGMGLAGVRGLLAGAAGEGAKTAARAVVCLILFDAYDDIFMTAVKLADGLAYYFREHSLYLQTLANLLNSMAHYIDSTDSTWDMTVGLLKGSVLAGTNIVSHWSVFAAVVFVMYATLVALNLLYVLGPLMIACGVFCDGMTLRNWAQSLSHVLLWPVFPFFVMMVSGYITSDIQLAHDNLSSAMMTNIVLFVLIFLTPIVVGFIMSRGGVAAMGAMAWGAAIGMASRAITRGAVSLGAGAGATAAGGEGADGAAPPASAGSSPQALLEGSRQPFGYFARGGSSPLFDPPSPYQSPPGDAGWVRESPSPSSRPLAVTPEVWDVAQGKKITVPSRILRPAARQPDTRA